MSALQTLNLWLSALGGKLGTDLAPDNKGACGLAFKNSIDINISLDPENEIIHVVSVLYDLPKDTIKRHTLLIEAMRLNGGLAQTGSGALAATPDNQGVMYCMACPIRDYDVKRFILAVDSFLGNSLSLRQSLDNPGPSFYNAGPVAASGSIQ